jgi:hypothetical protein
MSKPTETQADKLIRRVRQELIDDYDEELEMEREDWDMTGAGGPRATGISANFSGCRASW